MSEDYRAFYESKASQYPDEDPAAVLRYETALGMSALPKGGRVLDVACKDARLVQILERQNSNADYTGVDISERVIESDRKRYPQHHFEVANVMEGLPLDDDSIDRAFALEILEHVPSPSTLLLELRRVLKPDGLLLLSVPNPYYYMEVVNELRGHPDTEGHLYSFRDAELRGLLAMCGYEVKACEGTYLEIPKRVRGAFRTGRLWRFKNVSPLLARSRIYACRPNQTPKIDS